MALTYFYRKHQTSRGNLVVTNVCNFLLFCPSPIPAFHPYPIHALLQTHSLQQYVEDIIFGKHKTRCVTNCNDKVDLGLCAEGLFAAHDSEKQRAGLT